MLPVAFALETLAGLCHDLSAVPPNTPRQQKVLANLHRTLGAVMGDMGPEESTCRALFDKLTALQEAQDEADEAMALAPGLGL